MSAVAWSAAAAGLAALILYGFNIRSRWLLRRIPGPWPSWLTGNLMVMGPLGKSFLMQLEWSQKYGPVYVWWMGRRPAVAISDPDLIKEVCVRRFVAFHDRPEPMMSLGTGKDHQFSTSGLLFARGKKWSSIRAACEPLFHKGALHGYLPSMNQAAARLVERLETAAESGSSLDVTHVLAAATMDVIGKAAFGVDFHAQDSPLEPQAARSDAADPPVSSSISDSRSGKQQEPGGVGIVSDVLTAAKLVFKPFGTGMSPLLIVLFFAVPHLRFFWYKLAVVLGQRRILELAEARGFLWGAAQQLLDNARLAVGEPAGDGPALRASDTTVRQLAAFGRARRAYAEVTPADNTIISLLSNTAHRSTPLSDLEICSQLHTFMLAGYETTSLAMSYTLYALATHPAVQARVAAEVDAFGHERQVTSADLAAFPYTEAVFQEAMRMWPPVTAVLALVREAGADARVAGFHLPPGTRVQLNIWALHHDQRHYPDPDKFRPERFLHGSEEAEQRHPYAYIPFGVGPHKCIGYKFAMEEALVTLVHLMQRLEFRLDTTKHSGPLDLRASITLVPADGIWLHAHKRAAAAAAPSAQ